MRVLSTVPHSASTFWPRVTLRGLLDRIVAADARYRERIYLARIDDRILRDVGVTRADVAAALRQL